MKQNCLTARCVFTHILFFYVSAISWRSTVEGTDPSPEAKRIAKKECVSSGFFCKRCVFPPCLLKKQNHLWMIHVSPRIRHHFYWNYWWFSSGKKTYQHLDRIYDSSIMTQGTKASWERCSRKSSPTPKSEIVYINPESPRPLKKIVPWNC